jgi:DNA repair protein RadC
MVFTPMGVLKGDLKGDATPPGPRIDSLRILWAQARRGPAAPAQHHHVDQGPACLQRPREKLLQRGAASLADAELLALLLRTGLRGQGVLQLAEQRAGPWAAMPACCSAGANDLKGIKGLGPAKRAELAAVIEMARRALAQPLADAPVFDSPQMVKDYLQLHLGGLQHEVFAVLFLDNQHRLISLEEMFHRHAQRRPASTRARWSSARWPAMPAR